MNENNYPTPQDALANMRSSHKKATENSRHTKKLEDKYLKKERQFGRKIG